ncbi:spore germination protein [uncultured Metabacillus sp.]|uniref:spore germination protein n=1 Tax=Metabacillus sp. Hm71 TaxID=3450743 RepID=UPI0026179FB4|nr:spore germination protein [uncultured Metabacillus sp.]
MPAIVGPVQLNSIEGNAIFKVGDSFSLSPKSADKSSSGSGVANSGDFIEMHNLFNITNFSDIDLFDQSDFFNS